MSDKDRIINRESGLDLVRAIACFFVVAVHFYLNCGYYNELLVGKKMFIMTACRWLFISSVPLFFMLTGYFMLNRQVGAKHYKGIVPLLLSYVVISVAKMLIYNKLYGKIYSVGDIFKNLGNYQVAWYMGMYLCLFLLVPFLNKMWNGLNDIEKNVLIGIMIFLCGLYPIFNYIAPVYFIGIYPVMYYFIGAVIRQRQYTYNKFVLVLIAVVVSVIEAVISVKCTKTGMFDWTVISTADGTYGTLLMCITAVCIFLAVYKINIKSYAIKRLLASISSVSFEIYLFAGIYDAIIYQYLKRTVTGANQFFWWFFVTVPLSFILAYISSVIFKTLVGAITKVAQSLHH